MGTLGILLRAKQEMLLPAVTPFLNRLQALGFFLNAETRHTVLKLANEL